QARYPGTNGSQHGERKVTAPAAAATGRASSSGPDETRLMMLIVSWPPMTFRPALTCCRGCRPSGRRHASAGSDDYAWRNLHPALNLTDRSAEFSAQEYSRRCQVLQTIVVRSKKARRPDGGRAETRRKRGPSAQQFRDRIH